MWRGKKRFRTTCSGATCRISDKADEEHRLGFRAVLRDRGAIGRLAGLQWHRESSPNANTRGHQARTADNGLYGTHPPVYAHPVVVKARECNP
jgi:hypothetical protein